MQRRIGSGKMNVKLEDAGFRREDSVKKFSSSPVVTAREDDTIEQAAKKILEMRVRRLPVVDRSQKIAGMLTILDILAAVNRGEGPRTRVKTIMTKHVVACYDSDNVEFALARMKTSRRGGIPIVSKNMIDGIITEKDFAKNFEGIRFGKTLEEIMIRNPLVMKVEQTAYDAMKLMSASRLRGFPVIAAEVVMGVVTARDILTILVTNNFDIQSLKVPVASSMRNLVIKLPKNADVSEAVKIMDAAEVSGVVVTDTANKLQGIVTYRDVLKLID